MEDEKALHVGTNQYSCNINPDAIELFVLYAIKGIDSIKGKEILIKVTGQDIKSITQKVIL